MCPPLSSAGSVSSLSSISTISSQNQTSPKTSALQSDFSRLGNVAAHSQPTRASLPAVPASFNAGDVCVSNITRDALGSLFEGAPPNATKLFENLAEVQAMPSDAAHAESAHEWIENFAITRSAVRSFIESKLTEPDLSSKQKEGFDAALKLLDESRDELLKLMDKFGSEPGKLKQLMTMLRRDKRSLVERLPFSSVLTGSNDEHFKKHQKIAQKAASGIELALRAAAGGKNEGNIKALFTHFLEDKVFDYSRLALSAKLGGQELSPEQSRDIADFHRSNGLETLSDVQNASQMAVRGHRFGAGNLFDIATLLRGAMLAPKWVESTKQSALGDNSASGLPPNGVSGQDDVDSAPRRGSVAGAQIPSATLPSLANLPPMNNSNNIGDTHTHIHISESLISALLDERVNKLLDERIASKLAESFKGATQFDESSQTPLIVRSQENKGAQTDKLKPSSQSDETQRVNFEFNPLFYPKFDSGLGGPWRRFGASDSDTDLNSQSDVSSTGFGSGLNDFDESLNRRSGSLSSDSESGLLRQNMNDSLTRSTLDRANASTQADTLRSNKRKTFGHGFKLTPQSLTIPKFIPARNDRQNGSDLYFARPVKTDDDFSDDTSERSFKRLATSADIQSFTFARGSSVTSQLSSGAETNNESANRKPRAAKSSKDSRAQKGWRQIVGGKYEKVAVDLSKSEDAVLVDARKGASRLKTAQNSNLVSDKPTVADNEKLVDRFGRAFKFGQDGSVITTQGFSGPSSGNFSVKAARKQEQE